MPINILTSIDQFCDGADLWIFPELSKSQTLKKLDWYLNFQAYNSEFKNSKPTLISSHNKLPTKAVLSVPFNGDLNQWCDTIDKAWNGLNFESFRLFLPDNIKDISKLNFNADLKTFNVVLG